MGSERLWRYLQDGGVLLVAASGEGVHIIVEGLQAGVLEQLAKTNEQDHHPSTYAEVTDWRHRFADSPEY